MDKEEFLTLRQNLQKTQKEMSQLLGISLRALQSFEQGWRLVPVHVERQMLFLHAMKKRMERKNQPCWEIQKCSPETCQACPAREFEVGHLCWFINGTICKGEVQKSWKDKMKICRKCRVFVASMKV